MRARNDDNEIVNRDCGNLRGFLLSLHAFTALVPRLPTAQVAATTDFYVSQLGFRVGAAIPDGDPKFWILERDGVSLQFTASAQPLNSETTICIDVPDASAVHEVRRTDFRSSGDRKYTHTASASSRCATATVIV